MQRTTFATLAITLLSAAAATQTFAKPDVYREPATFSGEIGAESEIWLSFNTEDRRTIHIEAEGDSHARFNLYFHEPMGRVVASDIDGRGACELTYTPTCSRPHKIRLVNLDDAPASYQITVD